MSQETTLKVEERTAHGQNASRRLRREGQIPAVVYGDAKDSIPVTIDLRTLQQVLRSDSGANTLLTLEFSDEAKSCKALIREIQIEPLRDDILHADFIRVSMDREIEIAVQLEFVGTAEGVKNEGGILHINRHEVEIACLPGDIPDVIEVDVSELSIGDEIRVSELTLPEKVRAVTEEQRLIVHVVPPTLVKVDEEEPAEGELPEGELPEGETPEDGEGEETKSEN